MGFTAKRPERPGEGKVPDQTRTCCRNGSTSAEAGRAINRAHRKRLVGQVMGKKGSSANQENHPDFFLG